MQKESLRRSKKPVRGPTLPAGAKPNIGGATPARGASPAKQDCAVGNCRLAPLPFLFLFCNLYKPPALSPS